MAKIKNKDLRTDVQLKAIEVLKSELQMPSDADKALFTFNFNLQIESKTDVSQQLVFVITHVEINNEDHSGRLGAVTVSCIFEIENFDSRLKIDSHGRPEIPDYILEKLTDVSISTTRGVMFSTFKGTFLHAAVLPLIDVNKLQLGSHAK